MADITAEITLLPAGRSARKGPLVGKWFNCSIVVDKSLYEVRFELGSAKTIPLGSTVTLEATFNEPDAVMQLLGAGKTFTLWERGALGHGTVVKVHAGR